MRPTTLPTEPNRQTQKLTKALAINNNYIVIFLTGAIIPNVQSLKYLGVHV